MKRIIWFALSVLAVAALLLQSCTINIIQNPAPSSAPEANESSEPETNSAANESAESAAAVSGDPEESDVSSAESSGETPAVPEQTAMFLEALEKVNTVIIVAGETTIKISITRIDGDEPYVNASIQEPSGIRETFAQEHHIIYGERDFDSDTVFCPVKDISEEEINSFISASSELLEKFKTKVKSILDGLTEIGAEWVDEGEYDAVRYRLQEQEAEVYYLYDDFAGARIGYHELDETDGKIINVALQYFGDYDCGVEYDGTDSVPYPRFSSFAGNLNEQCGNLLSEKTNS